MTDELFGNIMDHIENKISPDCPSFIEKEIDILETHRSCCFRFNTTSRLDVVLEYEEWTNLFSIEVYLFEEQINREEVELAEETYLSVKKELLHQLKKIPSFRLQLIYSEDRVVDDLAKDTIRHWKS